jgi:uncharacterized protein YwqG
VLLQIDDEPSAGMAWGDAGALNFGIATRDLASRRFDRVNLVGLCC